MIKISNSESFCEKFKSFFIGSNKAPVEKSVDNSVDNTTEEKSITSNEDFSDVATKENATIMTEDFPVNVLDEETDEELECLKSFENFSQNIGKRIIFKIHKSKFEYPTAKSTTLTVKANLPIVKSVQSSQEEREYIGTQKIEDACQNKDVYGSYNIDYTQASVQLLVDFSVVLYNKIDSTIVDCPDNISNLDIYAMENESFLNEPFGFCYVGDCIGLSPYDFKVELTPVQTIVDPVCELEDYYLYVVDVTITISFLPKVTIYTDDTVSLAKINAAVGIADPTNNVFSRGELASITKLDLSKNPNLDFNLFQYLVNLSELDISETTSDPNKLEKLAVLKQLEILIAKNNYITDYRPLGKLTSLKELYLDNGVTNLSFTVNISALEGNDITPLINLLNLEVLSLAQNNIYVLPESLSRLTKLQELNLNDNNIEDLTNLQGLVNIKSLSLENNPIRPETLPPTIPVTSLNLSNTNLTNAALCNLTLPETLELLNVSNNHLYDLSCLSESNTSIIANNQSIFYGNLLPDEDEPTTFIFDLDNFIKDKDYSTPENITDITEGGQLIQNESAYENYIIWQDIIMDTEVSFEFANSFYEDTTTFSGTVTLTLKVTPVVTV